MKVDEAAAAHARISKLEDSVTRLWAALNIVVEDATNLREKLRELESERK